MKINPDRQSENLQTEAELITEQLKKMLLEGSYHQFVISPESDEIRKLSFLELLFSDSGLSEDDLLNFTNSFFKSVQAQRNQSPRPKSYNKIIQEQLNLSLEEANFLEKLLKEEESKENPFSFSSGSSFIDEIRRIVERKRKDSEQRSPFVQLSAAISMEYSDVLSIDSQKRITKKPVLQAVVGNDTLTESQKSMLIGIFIIQRYKREGKYSDILKEQLGIDYNELTRFASKNGTDLPEEDVIIAIGGEHVEPQILRAIFVYLEDKLAKQAEEAENQEKSITIQEGSDAISDRVEHIVEFPELTVSDDPDKQEIPPQNLFEFALNLIEKNRFVYCDSEVEPLLLTPSMNPDDKKSLLGLILSPNLRFDPNNPSISNEKLKELAEVCINSMKEKYNDIGRIHAELSMVIRDLENEIQLASDFNIKLQLKVLADTAKTLREDLNFVPQFLQPGQIKKPDAKSSVRDRFSLILGSRPLSGIHKTAYLILLAAAVATGFTVLFSKPELDKKSGQKQKFAEGKSPVSSSSAPKQPKPDKIIKSTSDFQEESVEVEVVPKFSVVLTQSVIDGKIIINRTLTENLLTDAGWNSVTFENGDIIVESEEGKTAKLGSEVFEEVDSVGEVELEGKWRDL
ncbi:hypothetical protein GF366_01725 [Candidatus Peregrinibacteria bacterium]|nr:hypothetical protein [Candidatus Peregrinibacteria bacterium]